MAGVSLLSASEIDQIRSLLGLSNLEVSMRPSWGSQSSNYREEIHGEVKKKMAKAYPFSDSSISHCRTLGGFAFTQYDSNHVLQIGFDIEEDERVTEQIAKRICKTAEEFSRAPSPASLWAAKEAAFKSLKGPKQPFVVSQFELLDWVQIDSHVETVSVGAPEFYSCTQIKGVVFKKAPFTFAFFAATP